MSMDEIEVMRMEVMRMYEIADELIDEAMREGWSEADLIATAWQRSAAKPVSDVLVYVPPNPDTGMPGHFGVPRASREV